MIRFITMSGFLGAGKTTTLIAAARVIEAGGQRAAVITNDQGTDLVDTKLVRSHLDSVAEVTGGCFCCRFEDLTDVAQQLSAANDVDVVIAEAVGSCTDIQATVVRPLRKFHGDAFVVAPLTTVVDPLRLLAFVAAEERGEPESNMSYLFGRQLLEAEILAVNKVDQVPADKLDKAMTYLSRRNPQATIVTYSARTGQGLDELIAAWQGEASWEQDLEVDYDRYAAAEAELAWLNRALNVTSTSAAGFSADAWCEAALNTLSNACRERGFPIGHAKVSLESTQGMTKMSVTGVEASPSVDLRTDAPASEGKAVVNARVACTPEQLDEIVEQLTAAADAAAGTSSEASDNLSFQPGYPRPIHRLTAAQAQA